MSGHNAEGDAGAYVRAMSDADLADLLDADRRLTTGRCVSPPILRAAQVEAEVRGA